MTPFTIRISNILDVHSLDFPAEGQQHLAHSLQVQPVLRPILPQQFFQLIRSETLFVGFSQIFENQKPLVPMIHRLEDLFHSVKSVPREESRVIHHNGLAEIPGQFVGLVNFLVIGIPFEQQLHIGVGNPRVEGSEGSVESDFPLVLEIKQLENAAELFFHE